MRLVPLLLLLLAACAPRAQVDLVIPAPGAVLQTVHVATSRAAGGEAAVPTAGRAEQLGFGRYVVAIPPRRAPGTLPRPRREQPVDPQRHIALAEAVPQDAAAFRRDLTAALAAEPRGRREVTIFVHGFNTHFIEGVYRIAQLGHDLQIPGVLAHYAWPSAGAPLAYAHDRDSALFARDGLQRMLHEVTAAGAPRIVLMAHSMGAHLVMETLRQMALDGSQARVPLGGVVLISPDIDVDVFASQARRIGRLPQPFLVMTSQRDRVLALSARLTGQPDRLGNLSDPARVAGLGVTVLDITAFGSGDGHFTVADSPALIRLLGRIGAVDAALAGDPSAALPLIPGTILTLQGTTEILLNPLGDPRARRLLPFARLRAARLETP